MKMRSILSVYSWRLKRACRCGNGLFFRLSGYLSPAVILSAAVLIWMMSAAGADAQQSMTPMVTVSTVAVQDVNPPDEYVGHVEAIQSVELMARVQGFLEQVHFEEGSDVALGDLLYVIEQAPYQAAVDADKAAVAQAQAASLKAQQYLKRVREVRSGGVSATDIENAEAEALRTEAQLQGAKANLERSELNLSYTRVTAPISGRIGRTAFTKGNLVGPNSGTLTRIVQLDPVRVVYSISENDIAAVKSELADSEHREDSPALKVRLKLADGDIFGTTGRIDFLDNTVDADTGTITARAVFDNPGGKLIPGQYVTVLVSRSKPRLMPVVPQASVVEDREGKYVLLVTDKNEVAQRRITSDVMTGGYWSVSSGLSGGEKVIVEGIQKVKPGQTVTIKPTEGK